VFKTGISEIGNKPGFGRAVHIYACPKILIVDQQFYVLAARDFTEIFSYSS